MSTTMAVGPRVRAAPGAEWGGQLGKVAPAGEDRALEKGSLHLRQAGAGAPPGEDRCPALHCDFGDDRHSQQTSPDCRDPHLASRPSPVGVGLTVFAAAGPGRGCGSRAKPPPRGYISGLSAALAPRRLRGPVSCGQSATPGRPEKRYRRVPASEEF